MKAEFGLTMFGPFEADTGSLTLDEQESWYWVVYGRDGFRKRVPVALFHFEEDAQAFAEASSEATREEWESR